MRDRDAARASAVARRGSRAERLDAYVQDQALALSSDDPLANCSLTAFDADRDGRLELRTAGWTVPVAASGAAVTVAPDAVAR